MPTCLPGNLNMEMPQAACEGACLTSFQGALMHRRTGADLQQSELHTRP